MTGSSYSKNFLLIFFVIVDVIMSFIHFKSLPLLNIIKISKQEKIDITTQAGSFLSQEEVGVF